MSFSVFEKIDPSCQNGSMEKAKNIPYHQRPYASIAERTLVDISIYSPRPQIAGTGHSHSKISIHSPRAGRDCRYPNAPLITQISIHSPRMGRDQRLQIHAEHGMHFNPLSPHGERRTPSGGCCGLRNFNPFSPHGERPRNARCPSAGQHFNPLSPHGERRARASHHVQYDHFNPLSPHGERRRACAGVHLAVQFQSTLPAWGETPLGSVSTLAQRISIHSPRMGRDRTVGPVQIPAAPFQSTLPAWGETRSAARRFVSGAAFQSTLPTRGETPDRDLGNRSFKFQSTLPTRGETVDALGAAYNMSISIHSPHTGRDAAAAASGSAGWYFNPLSPHGERPDASASA